jgi:hypothetical protein
LLVLTTLLGEELEMVVSTGAPLPPVPPDASRPSAVSLASFFFLFFFFLVFVSPFNAVSVLGADPLPGYII